MFALQKVTDMSHRYLDLVISPGDQVIDATAGNGYDTEYLAQKVGPQGHVYAFDIQTEALTRTAERLRKSALYERVTLIKSGHEKLTDYITEPVVAVTYNLGYLPGGDLRLVTKVQTTIESLSQALSLLNMGGIITITMYPGHEEGNYEKLKLIPYCKKLSTKEFTVLHLELLNRQKQPPELIIVQKQYFQ